LDRNFSYRLNGCDIMSDEDFILYLMFELFIIFILINIFGYGHLGG